VGPERFEAHPSGARRRRPLVAVAAAVALPLALGACGEGTAERRISVASQGSETVFTPESVTVDKGDRVVIQVSNPTDREHGFSIAGYRITEVVAPRGTAEVRFDAGRAGTYRIFCQLHEAHRPATLVVR
jgi:nitrosocyanin